MHYAGTIVVKPKEDTEKANSQIDMYLSHSAGLCGVIIEMVGRDSKGLSKSAIPRAEMTKDNIEMVLRNEANHVLSMAIRHNGSLVTEELVRPAESHELRLRVYVENNEIALEMLNAFKNSTDNWLSDNKDKLGFLETQLIEEQDTTPLPYNHALRMLGET